MEVGGILPEGEGLLLRDKLKSGAGYKKQRWKGFSFWE